MSDRAEGRSARRALLFDWDDTLSGAFPHRYDTVAEVVERLGRPLSRREIHRAWTVADDPVLGRIENGFWLRLRRELGLDGRAGAADALMDAFERREAVRQMSLYDEVDSALARLAADGWILGVVSNNVVAIERIAELGLTDRFSAVVTPRDTGGVGKPQPEIFRAALERLAIAPERTIYIGDTYEVDVLGARAAGLRAVLIDRMGLCDAADCEILPSLVDLAARLPDV